MGLFDPATDDETRAQRNNMGLLGLMTGLGMMQANQPGTSMGQAIGAGGMQGVQGMMAQQRMAQQQKQQDMLNQIRQVQLQQGDARLTPSSVREYEYAKSQGYQGSFEDYKGNVAGRNETPANIREWEAYNKLSPQDQARYLTMKRSNPYLNLGDQMVQPNPVQPGQAMGGFAKGITPDAQPDLKGAQARESAIGRVQGETQATSAVNLPQTIAQAENSMQLVDDILNDPAFANVVGLPGSVSGLSSKFGAPVMGSPEAGFISKIDQLKGQQFMQAYETLKGGGQITEVEGKKATEAISRMTNTNQSEADYRKAAEDFKKIIQGAVSRAKMKAGGQAAPKGASAGWSIQKVD